MDIEVSEPELHKLNFKFWKTLYQELINAHFTVIAKSVWNSVKVQVQVIFFPFQSVLQISLLTELTEMNRIKILSQLERILRLFWTF